MIRFALNKLAYGLAVLAGIVVVIFFLFNVLPGDPARMTMGQRADVQSLEAVRKEFGLDQPLYVQFGYYVNDLLPIAVHGDDSASRAKYHYLRLAGISKTQALVVKFPYLRRSYQTRREVSAILGETIPNTLVLAFVAMIFATVVGIFMGIVSAVNRDTWIDRCLNAVAVLGISAPSFFAGILVAWLFGFVWSDFTHLNMSGSLYSYDPFRGEVLHLENLLLPALTLGVRPLAIIVQLTRSSMLDVLGQDYIRTARAKGVSERGVVYRHALKNALNPVITAVSGWFASLLAGSFFVEYIFGYNGLGKATVDALEYSDFPVIMGAVLFIAFIFVLINLLADLAYAWADPRISL